MSQPGAADILVAARRALLDAMDALAEHRSALVLVGAQAIYLHTGNAPVALAESTRDSDLAINPRQLRDDPLLEEAMRRAGFTHDASASQPGSWLSPDGVPVDLMVPEQLAGAGSRRSGRVAPHSDRATRRAIGLEAAVIDHAPMRIAALEPGALQRNALPAQDDLAAANPGHLEQVINETHHLPQLALHHGQGSMGNITIIREPQDLQAVAHRCQRVAQLVRQRR